MRLTGERTVFGGARGMGVFVAMLAAALLTSILLAAQAGAQEATAGEAPSQTSNATTGASARVEDFIARAGNVSLQDFDQTTTRQSQAANETRQATQATDPLAGQTAFIKDTDSDGTADTVGPIAVADCTVAADATIVVEDADETQATLVNGQNVTMTVTSTPDGISIEGTDPDGNIVDENPTGGDSDFDTGTGKVISSTGITCGDGTSSSNGAATQQQDTNKGPLAGGVAIGNDVLVKGDLIRTLPDGTKVFGIDQITIETKNCDLTATSDELTITLSDQGTPFRLIDGQNVDITIRDDSTVVASGREELGNLFPVADRDNPTRIIVPIPVEAGNDNFSETPNDTFPIISSTGISGEGCTTTGRSDNPDDVVPGTTPNQTLADTGGMPLTPVIPALGVMLSGAGWMLWTRLRRQ